MSYQAITDFLVNPIQLQQDFQNFKPNKDTFSVQSSSSFEDLVSFYSEMNEAPEKESPKVENSVQEKSSENKISGENSDKKTEQVEESDEKVTMKSEKVDESDKTEDSKEKNDVKNQKLSLEENLVKKTSDSAEKDEDSVQIKKADIVVQKEIPSEKKSESDKKTNSEKKKIASKEFARMEQFTEVKNNQSAELVAAKDVKNLPEDGKKEKSNNENDKNSDLIVELSETKSESESLALKTFAEDAQNQNQKNFSNEKGVNEEKKELTLDPEGKIKVEDLRSEKSFATELKQTDSNTVEMTMNLANDAQTDLLSLNNQTASANGSNFQAMLSNQIQASAPEFVKAGTIVLKDNDQGTINLVLHPDDLGNVKVHLSMDGKSMSAQIIVSSKEALQVFKDNSETLREAFIKEGFDVSDFEVAYNDNGSFNQNMEFGGQQEDNHFVAQHVYNSVAGGAVSDFESDVQKNDEFSNYSINIVA